MAACVQCRQLIIAELCRHGDEPGRSSSEVAQLRHVGQYAETATASVSGDEKRLPTSGVTITRLA